MQETDVKEFLAREDENFRKLWEQHQAYEQQLEEFVRKPYLNSTDQLKETEIKKKKLVLKDRMQMLISRYQAQHSPG